MPVDFDGLIGTAAMNAFARTVVHTPQGAPAYATRGDFRSPHVTEETYDGTRTTRELALLIRLSEWAIAPKQRDSVTIEGTVYVIVDVHPDGEGGARLPLRLD